MEALNLYITVSQVVGILLQVYWYLLIARAFLSFFPDVWDTSLGRWLVRLTEPYLAPFRRFIPSLPLGAISLDLSYIVALVVYYFLERGVMLLLFWIFRAVGVV
ncbi:YggT family protein [Kyrpidia tusciae]|uniref:YggT family protein n=1 Tax=Kyrpidia tusciae (strain DSM 2912 / NBRC 15312 / T2) TaxID=562970 RepID=D5WQD2_KYRT2|nr:YggT family protein [Kyrpidia tusciae]ADG06541.1 protein of unknown function YGGT [Kyrpidia tusciae DSM 2912]